MRIKQAIDQLVHWKHYPWLLWLLGGGFFFIEYFIHVSISVMLPQLMQAFQVGALGLGAMSAYFWYAYTAMQMPVGALVDRYGPHRLLAWGAMLSGASTLLFGMAHTLWVAELSRFWLGLTSSFAFVGTLKLCKMWFPSTRFGLLAGMTQGVGMLGAAVGEAPVAFAVESIGWRKTTWAMAGIIFFLGVIIKLIARDHPDAINRKQTNTQSFSGMRKGFGQVLKNPQTWINGLCVGMMYMPTSTFGELWGVNYYIANYGFSKALAATAVGFIFIGWVIGGPLAGMLSDWLRKRKPVLIVSAIGSLLSLSLALYLPHLSIYTLCGLLLAYGIFNTGVGVSYALSGEINPLPLAGFSMAFANMSSVLMGAACQPIVGWLIELQWNHQSVNGIPIYTPYSYKLAMLTMPIGLAISVIAALFIRETHCKPYETQK